MEETKMCPYCGEEILAVAKKCKHCGEWLNLDKACPVCGETIPADAVVCPVCGERIDADNVQNVVPQPTPQPIPITPAPALTPPAITPESSFSEPAVGSNAPADEENKARGFFEYYFKENFLNFKFKGNTPKRQYWIGLVAFAMVNVAFWGLIIAVSALLENLTLLYVGYAVYSIASMCTLPTLVRRLHDTGKSGWFFCVAFIPLIGIIWLLVLLAKKGKEESKSVEINTTDKIIFAVVVVGIILSVVFSGRIADIMFDPYYEYNQQVSQYLNEDIDSPNAIVASGDILSSTFDCPSQIVEHPIQITEDAVIIGDETFEGIGFDESSLDVCAIDLNLDGYLDYYITSSGAHWCVIYLYNPDTSKFMLTGGEDGWDIYTTKENVYARSYNYPYWFYNELKMTNDGLVVVGKTFAVSQSDNTMGYYEDDNLNEDGEIVNQEVPDPVMENVIENFKKLDVNK